MAKTSQNTRNAKISSEALKLLTELVEDHKNPNHICNELKENYKIEINYNKLSKLILNKLNRVWIDNRYVPLCNKCKDVKNIEESGIPTPIDEPPKQISLFDSLASDSPECFEKELRSALNSLYSLKSKACTIELQLKKLDTIQTSLDKLLQVDFSKKRKEFVDSFAKIYNSDKSKKSINLNNELQERVVSVMSEKYGLSTHNLSTAINTALILSILGDD